MPGKFEAHEKPDNHATPTIGTPEGDNEFAPDQPLKPLPEGAEEIPRGSAPDPYKGE